MMSTVMITAKIVLKKPNVSGAKGIQRMLSNTSFFSWDDPLHWKDQLNKDELQVFKTANEFCRAKLLPRIIEANRYENFDRRIVNELGEMGFLGATLDGYGCAGVNYVTYGIIANAIERIDSGYRSVMSVQSSLVMGPIHEYGTDAQKQKYLPRLATGELLGE